VINWVRFHAQLRTGDKRGIPRAWRFVYMELSHEARERGGWVALPIGMTDLAGVQELLGGNRREVAEAIKFYTSGTEPSLAFADVEGKRSIVVHNWRKWNPKSDDSGPRVALHRAEKKAPPDTPDDPECNVTSNTVETVSETEQKRGVTPRARALISSSLISSSESQEREPEREPPRNATADGAFGMSISAWCDGVRSVTKKPLTRISIAETKVLVDVFAAHCPRDKDVVEWARDKGALFASSEPPTLSAFKFKDWVDKGETAWRPSGTRKRGDVQPVGEGRPDWLPEGVPWNSKTA
jgi:hypothetical protein